MSRVTVQDVADAAGVSLATVDRVLNNRKGVRAETVDRVKDAMERLNFVRDQSAANLCDVQSSADYLLCCHTKQDDHRFRVL